MGWALFRLGRLDDAETLPAPARWRSGPTPRSPRTSAKCCGRRAIARRRARSGNRSSSPIPTTRCCWKRCAGSRADARGVRRGALALARDARCATSRRRRSRRRAGAPPRDRGAVQRRTAACRRAAAAKAAPRISPGSTTRRRDRIDLVHAARADARAPDRRAPTACAPNGPTGAASRRRDWDDMTARVLGVPVPVQGLAAWLRGAVARHHAEQRRARRAGPHQRAAQDGWEIVYAYADDAARAPARLTLRYPRASRSRCASWSTAGE